MTNLRAYNENDRCLMSRVRAGNVATRSIIHRIGSRGSVRWVLIRGHDVWRLLIHFCMRG